ncbi:subclass B3 metallo-beta-lactamase [Terrimonas ferruginea]|uniref:subclass B3 metallo-beta-lactamase n=1 Tax=Terrimonas ferruginea TaxID=249 RepID=UPI00040A6687|nr:subclass B3 metallo-beta-lactamase [Terrimonas ferruginea]
MKRLLFFIVILCGSCLSAKAQTVKEPKPYTQDWAKPYAPFRIAGNLYYVGTYDLACYLVTSPQGHILINTGLAASADMIRKSVEQLGFKFSDIKILLTTQAHYDHLGAMAAIQDMTGARFFVDRGDSAVVVDGGTSDYALGGDNPVFRPVRIDKLLNDGDTISLGNNHLKMLHHPGHTQGSCSFLLDVKDEQKTWHVLIANIPTIVTDKHFNDIPAYPHIAEDYAYTLDAMKALRFDIWVASHAGQFDLHKKHKPGARYNPAAFSDRAGYDEALKDCREDFEKSTANKMEQRKITR